jgi:hypothetical protein
LSSYNGWTVKVVYYDGNMNSYQVNVAATSPATLEGSSTGQTTISDYYGGIEFIAYGTGNKWIPVHYSCTERWEDLRFPASALNVAGPGGTASRDNNDGTLVFADGANDWVVGLAQVPHSWKEGSTMRPHVHWYSTSTSTGNVELRFEYDIANVDGTFSQDESANPWTNALTATQAGSGTARYHHVLSLGDLTMTSCTDSCIIRWRINRDARVSNTNDTFSGDVKMLEFDIHYQVNSRGTVDEFNDPDD